MGKPSKEKNQPTAGRGRGRGRGRGGRGGPACGGRGRSARSTFGPAEAGMFGNKPDSVVLPVDDDSDQSDEAGMYIV